MLIGLLCKRSLILCLYESPPHARFSAVYQHAVCLTCTLNSNFMPVIEGLMWRWFIILSSVQKCYILFDVLANMTDICSGIGELVCCLVAAIIINRWRTYRNIYDIHVQIFLIITISLKMCSKVRNRCITYWWYQSKSILFSNISIIIAWRIITIETIYP